MMTDTQRDNLLLAIARAEEPGACRYVNSQVTSEVENAVVVATDSDEIKPICVIGQLAVIEGANPRKLHGARNNNISSLMGLRQGIRREYLDTNELDSAMVEALNEFGRLEDYNAEFLWTLQRTWDGASPEGAPLARERMTKRVLDEYAKNEVPA